MHVAGGYWFNGAGVITVIGNARTNLGTSTNQHGIGLHICNVAGVTQVIGASSYTAAAARSQIAYGTDTFMAGTSSIAHLISSETILIGSETKFMSPSLSLPPPIYQPAS
jgi:hypothetical protein